MVPDSLNTLPLDSAVLPAAAPKPQTPTNQKSRRQKAKRNRSKNVAAEKTSIEADCEDTNEVEGALNQINVKDDRSTGFWAALGSSDSEFSDVEHGSSALSVSQVKRNSSGRIRLHALACFHAFIKVICSIYSVTCLAAVD